MTRIVTMNDDIALCKPNGVGARLEFLTEAHAESIPPVYISVFEDHPWHEELECGDCGTGPYSRGCSAGENSGDCEHLKSGKVKLLTSSLVNCVSCGGELSRTLRPMYSPEIVKEEFLAAVRQRGFVGTAAFSGENLVSFCWGYDFPLDHPPRTGCTWYNEAAGLLRGIGVDPATCFYHNESSTARAHQGKGLGQRVLSLMLGRAAERKEAVVFRTINEAMLRCYSKTFGVPLESISPIFEDPNPDKRQSWYMFNLR